MITKIVKKILEKYKDANLESEAAREKIAKEISEAIGDWYFIS